MTLISKKRWDLRKASKPSSHSFDPYIDTADSSPEVSLDLLGKKGSFGLKKQYKVKAKKKDKGYSFDLKNPGVLSIESETVIQFPNGESYSPEFGLLKTTLVCDAAPTLDDLTFEVDIPGAKFCLQPPLTQDEIDSGHSRPEWVVGSYAVFDSDGLKIAHIPRAFVVDGNGDWTWCEIAISGTELVVIIPPAWLASCTYPITLDPSMGYDSAGASNVAGLKDYQFYYIVGGGNGTVQQLYVSCASNPARNVTMGLYKRDGTSLGSTSEGSCPTTQGWLNLALASAQTISNGMSYIIAHNHDGGNMSLYYDVDTTGIMGYGFYADTYSAGALDSQIGTTTNTGSSGVQNMFSIYGTLVEAAGGGGASGFPRHVMKAG
jgi:hypothetical protein